MKISGSGQAAVTMPVMVPLGDGFTNAINPTSSTLNATLSLSGVSLVQWLRFAGPIMLVGLGFLIFATMTGY